MTIMGLNWLNYQETQRSNVARETENLRHDQATETLGYMQLGETVRTNKVNEGIKQGALEEDIRSDKVRESTNLLTLAEQVRSNKAREQENIKADRLRELENHRTNLAHEGLEAYKTDINLLSKVAPITALGQAQTLGNVNGFSVASEAFGNTLLNLVPIPKTFGMNAFAKIG